MRRFSVSGDVEVNRARLVAVVARGLRARDTFAFPVLMPSAARARGLRRRRNAHRLRRQRERGFPRLIRQRSRRSAARNRDGARIRAFANRGVWVRARGCGIARAWWGTRAVLVTLRIAVGADLAVHRRTGRRRAADASGKQRVEEWGHGRTPARSCEEQRQEEVAMRHATHFGPAHDRCHAVVSSRRFDEARRSET